MTGTRLEPEARIGLLVNGEAATTAAPTLEGLIEELGLAGAKVATAVNGAFVPERARAGQSLAEGDRVEIVAPRQGG
jgi:sulfur carrier protein